MARTKRSRRSYGAGEWGRNRVRIFPDPKTGNFQIEWRENGRRLTRSLGHRDWARAKRQADEFAAGFAGPEIVGRAEAKPEPLTLEKLFEPRSSGRGCCGRLLPVIGAGREEESGRSRGWWAMRVVVLRQWDAETPKVGRRGGRWRDGSRDFASGPESLGCGGEPQAGVGGGISWLRPRRAARVRRRTGSLRSSCR